MDNLGIRQLCRKCKPIRSVFAGTYPSDAIVPPHKYPAALIVNLDDSQHPGSHWIVIYCKSPTSAFYFCPLALYPNKWIEYFLSKFENVRVNICRFQSDKSTACAHYAIYVCHFMAKGMDFDRLLSRLVRSKNSDKMVRRFVGRLRKS